MRESLRQRDPAYTIVVQHNVLIRQIESFGRFKTFDDVTYVNVVDFDAFLRHTITSQPVIYKRHNTFKSYIVDAINRGLCKYSPYVQFKVPRGKSKTPVSPTIFMSSPSMGIGDKTRTIGIIIRGILSPSTITHVLKKVRRIAFITVWIIISIIII
jgi:hypothetical protein